MDKSHTITLKNREIIVFKTDMPEVEVKGLPVFLNQHKFKDHFQLTFTILLCTMFIIDVNYVHI